MMYTFDAMQAELAYRRELMTGEANRSRLGRLVRRRTVAVSTGRRREQVRDGTRHSEYDLAA